MPLHKAKVIIYFTPLRLKHDQFYQEKEDSGQQYKMTPFPETISINEIFICIYSCSYNKGI